MPSFVECKAELTTKTQMKGAKTAKTAAAGKRDLFAELTEGFDALSALRQGKRRLRTHHVKYKPTLRRPS
jgi:hypothetical protein